MVETRKRRTKRTLEEYVDTTEAVSDDEPTPKRQKKDIDYQDRSWEDADTFGSSIASSDLDGEYQEVSRVSRRTTRLSTRRNTRANKLAAPKSLRIRLKFKGDLKRSGEDGYMSYDASEEPSEDSSLDISRPAYQIPSRRSGRQAQRQTVAINYYEGAIEDEEQEEEEDEPSNQIAKSYPVPPRKLLHSRESFIPLGFNSRFGHFHMQHCLECGHDSTDSPLIYCQGCTLSFHQQCLGPSRNRQHLVTKIENGNYVLQCRKCVGVLNERDVNAPNLAQCMRCYLPSPSSDPFRSRKTPAEERQERQENNGEDPIHQIDRNLINSPDNVLFRCISCWRAFHFAHLRRRWAMTEEELEDSESDESGDISKSRFMEYRNDWLCKECFHMPGKISCLVAWRPVNQDAYQDGTRLAMVRAIETEYLIKWDGMSYHQVCWMPGSWVKMIAPEAMQRAFSKRASSHFPKMTTKDAIPEDYLRIEIVLDVEHTNRATINIDDDEDFVIQDISRALVKYKGLGYEDAVWENVPTTDEKYWADFAAAYDSWYSARWVSEPNGRTLSVDLERIRSQPFKAFDKSEQPMPLSGGKLMEYQLEGLNWLYYQWHSGRSCILADEMGLGKTVQMIALMSVLALSHTCFPFLVVVPNSTCANWRREIMHWSPQLRAVSYFGGRTARNMAHQYEMYPYNSEDLRCHVVITSYETIVNAECRKFFKSVAWQGLIVDEGHHVKSDQSLLYNTLDSLRIPFRVLLTGTPLQNNIRELFNLLQFVDDDISAKDLESKYSEMNQDTVRRLHSQIRQYILRRTKAQVLTSLPPMRQIIIPLSMSVLQKQLYKSILSQSPALVKSIFAQKRPGDIKETEKAALNNILMQLRKCLCHPFVYNRDIEERTNDGVVAHRNLVEASSKLQFLEVLLQKLYETGHRVLIFSQFLDMLSIVEDFLIGLGLAYRRLDGKMNSLQKQKNIDEFNEDGSQFFAFLLSTRAGGVGINLATADTVIILDPDFNPHQDMQAIARAHRMGQKGKVLCFQLATRDSVEEKILQLGRKKMALDHVVVNSIDREDELNDEDVKSILSHGAASLFDDDKENGQGPAGSKDIKYDSRSIEKLLDRSSIKSADPAEAASENPFSFTQVWKNEKAEFEDYLDHNSDDTPLNPSVWDRILSEREQAVKLKDSAQPAALGRGKRNKATVDYSDSPDSAAMDDGQPIRMRKTSKQGSRNRALVEGDEEFDAGSENDSDEGEVPPELVHSNELVVNSTTPGGLAMDGNRPATMALPRKKAPKEVELPVRPKPPSALKSQASIPTNQNRNTNQA